MTVVRRFVELAYCPYVTTLATTETISVDPCGRDIELGAWLYRSVPVPVPEPGAVGLLSLGLIGLGLIRIRRHYHSSA